MSMKSDILLNSVSEKKFLFLVYLLTLSMGILFIIFNPLPYTDHTDYDVHARNLLSGHGLSLSGQAPFFPDVYRTPGTGIFFYLIYLVFGPNYLMIKIIQALLNASIPIFVFYLCKRLFNSRFTYLITLVVAIYPFTALYVPVIDSAILCIFLFCLGLFLFEAARHKKQAVLFFLSGITFGCCLLVRPGTALMPLFLTIGYLLVAKFRKIWKLLVVFNLGVMLIWTPWIVRNYRVSGRFIPLTVEGHEMIYWSTGSIGRYLENRTGSPKFRQQMSEIIRQLERSKLTGMERVIREEQLYLKYAVQNIKDEPFKYALATIVRIPRMWISYVTTDAGRSFQFKGGRPLYIFVALLTAATFFVGVYGIWLLRHKWREMLFLGLPVFYFSITHMVILPEARFTLAARPFLMIFFLVGLLRRSKEWEKSSRIA